MDQDVIIAKDDVNDNIVNMNDNRWQLRQGKQACKRVAVIFINWAGLRLAVNNPAAKGSNGQAHQFEMLPGERNPDNGNGKQKSENQVTERNPNATKHQPKQVHNCREAAGRVIHVFDALAKRP